MLEDNQFIPPDSLKSQEYLEQKNSWTQDQKMKINTSKTKTVIFNFTKNYQFRTRLRLGGELLETVSERKLLGTILTSDMKWQPNTKNIVRKTYAKMELLRRLSGFGAPVGDLKSIYMTFIRSHCEQSCVVWHSGLTIQEENDLERVQKVALKIILKDQYLSYDKALTFLDLETLKDRQINLCLAFLKKCLGNPKMKELFPPNNRTHTIFPRAHEHFQVYHANTERMKNIPIIYMQNLLNRNIKRNKPAAQAAGADPSR